MDKEVRTARAYSTLEDASENESKEKTRFPEKNFDVVIKEELNKAPTDILILQSGSVDISNMKMTGDNPTKFSELFKQQAVVSATNLFTAVTNALVSHPELKKAVIMKQIPRYDPIARDPLLIKSDLSKLFNDTLDQLCLVSPFKDRITVGTHSLGCQGGIREARYKKGGLYDGVHMYGPSGKKSYTESILKIIRSCGYIKKSPPSYFRRFHQPINQADHNEAYFCPTQDADHHKDKDIRYANVATQNRFSSFNQENC